MAYNIYIVRGEDWMEEEHPITLNDIRKIMTLLGNGFRIDESGIVQATNPSGMTIRMNYGPFLEYADESGKKTIVIFEDGKCPMFSYRDEKHLAAMSKVADALGARLQGDEGEFY